MTYGMNGGMRKKFGLETLRQKRNRIQSAEMRTLLKRIGNTKI
jgi:hypothetical protein